MLFVIQTTLASLITILQLKVAWIHKDKKAILTVKNHVITRNPRIDVSQKGSETWNLHIRNVQKEDQGAYMCQINTTPMKDRITQLIVVGK